MHKNFLCAECGTENKLTNRFCIGCGARLAAGERKAAACSNCSTENPPNYKFCGQCGTKLELTCPNCGEVVPVESRFCPKCAYLCGEGKYNDALS
jgi:hypothetical protein